ncbi:glycosyltransferase family 61 protein [Cypionkella sp.]|uniref:glycosyltransferase family 61 protein n=1 Tax=Cypionkella sp. TaxID=2811411 RepID=UPI0026166E19|nr:glycosyltransferase family 61 protein [Cypionkella sp.]MDB5663931.1 hypothetical protein [Cypionkella sp.]
MTIDLMDANGVPSVEGGWSTQIRTVPNGVINHVKQGYLVHGSGVRDAEGAFVPESVLWRGRPLMVAPPVVEDPDYQPGRWVWGGKLLDHFGHFLIESTGRLWALDHLKGQIDGIVFIPEGNMTGETVAPALKGFQRLFFDLLGITLPIKVLTRPTRFETLEVPGQGFGIGPMAGGTALFRDFMQNRFGASVAADGPERLYISRSQLPLDLGGILGEARLERYLTDCGYETYHPQNHSLTEQIARYKAAKQVVGLDGSALHLFAMVGTPQQRVALIKRRSGPAPEGIVRHLSGFTQQNPLLLDAITHNWVRSDRKHADNFSYGELNFAALGRELSRNGFVSAGLGWRPLSAARAAVAMQRIEASFPTAGITFNAVPVPAKPPEERSGRHITRRGVPV